MYMKKDKSRRYMETLKALIFDANRKLKLLEVNNPFEYDDSEVAEISTLFFEQHKDFIDDYLKEHDDILESTAEQIRSWKNAICDCFFIVKSNSNSTILSCEDRNFEITGITHPISDIIPDGCNFVRTVLLPFEGIITYAYFVEFLPIRYSKNSQDMLDRLKKDASNYPLINNAEDFIAAAPAINEKIRNRKNEPDKNPVYADDEIIECSYGHFRSKYADFSYEERLKMEIEAVGENWDEIKKRNQKTPGVEDSVIDVCSKCASMCGICGIGNAYKQFAAWYPKRVKDITINKFVDIATNEEDYSLKYTDDYIISHNGPCMSDINLVSYVLIEGFNLDDPDDENVKKNQARMNEFLNELKNQHEKIPFKLLDNKLKKIDYLTYCCQIPEVDSLARYILERVPNKFKGEELIYAERLIFLFIDTFSWNAPTGDCISWYLESFKDYNEEEIKELLARILRAYNNFPIMQNNGIPPTILFSELNNKD